MRVQQSYRGNASGRVALLALLVACHAARARAPDPLAVPPGHVLVLSAHAVGTQDYVCLPDAAHPGQSAWSFIGPQAVLSEAGPDHRDVAIHLLSQVPGAASAPDPACIEAAGGAAQYCPAWRSLLDRSVVWGRKAASLAAGSGDACPASPGGVPCLLLRRVATQGAGLFGQVSDIRRLDTSGGAAPTTSCRAGQMALVPYTATYEFYAARP